MRRCHALLLQIVAACADQAPPSTAVVRDSAGIRIVENSTPMWQPGQEWRLSPEPVIEIGRGNAEEDQLYRVGGAVRLTDGRIAIANPGTGEIRFYGSDGALLRAAGGIGEGPGEYMGLTWIQRLGNDSLAAYDRSRLPRIDILDGEGRLARSVRLPLLEGWDFPRVYGVLNNGAIVAQSDSLAALRPPPGNWRGEIRLFHYAGDGESRTEIGRFADADVFSADSDGGRSRTYIEPWFARSTRFRVARDRIYVGTNDTYEIQVLSPAGQVMSLIRKAHVPVDVTEADRAVMRSPLEEIDDENLRRHYATMLRDMRVPSTMPAFGVRRWRSGYAEHPIHVDRLGNLWVREYNRPGNHSSWWSVFDADGRFLGPLRFPDRFVPLDIGRDYVLGLFKDEFDVEYVQLYDLIKAEE